MMDSLHPLQVHAILKKYGLHPDRSLGQNFLIDDASLKKVVTTAEITSDDEVLEIGAGLGSLTRYLATAARHVTAIEVDRGLIPALKEVLEPFSNITIVEGDIMKMDPASLVQSGSYAVVANIPYYITSALIRRLLEAHPQPDRLVLTVQTEVAERICAQAGQMSLLALSVQLYGEPQITGRIPAGAFYPAPKVDSAIIRVRLLPMPRIPGDQINTFFRLARAGFSQKRKNLRNTISGGMGWSKTTSESLLRASGIDPTRRAETLSLEEWGLLAQAAERDELI
jgi:16S rRNA (adenine1518-N6/adenine1519-N6)-dimethyltransferase